MRGVVPRLSSIPRSRAVLRERGRRTRSSRAPVRCARERDQREPVLQVHPHRVEARDVLAVLERLAERHRARDHLLQEVLAHGDRDAAAGQQRTLRAALEIAAQARGPGGAAGGVLRGDAADGGAAQDPAGGDAPRVVRWPRTGRPGPRLRRVSHRRAYRTERWARALSRAVRAAVVPAPGQVVDLLTAPEDAPPRSCCSQAEVASDPRAQAFMRKRGVPLPGARGARAGSRRIALEGSSAPVRGPMAKPSDPSRRHHFSRSGAVARAGRRRTPAPSSRVGGVNTRHVEHEAGLGRGRKRHSRAWPSTQASRSGRRGSNARRSPAHAAVAGDRQADHDLAARAGALGEQAVVAKRPPRRGAGRPP